MRALLLFWLAALPVLATGTVTFTGSPTSTRTIRNFQDSDYKPVLTLTPVQRLTVPGTQTTLAPVNGRIFFQNTGATVYYDQQLGFSASGSLYTGLPTPSYTAVNSGVGTLAGSYFTQTNDGPVTFTAQAPNIPATAAVTTTLTHAAGVITQTFHAWSSGLLPYDLVNEIDSRLTAAGTASSSTMCLFSAATETNTVHSYTRNTSVWTGSIDLSGVSVSNEVSGVTEGYSSYSNAQGTWSGGSCKFNVTLITPTDFLTAAHAPPLAGETYFFVDNSNNTYSATVPSSGGLTSVSGTDLEVGHLIWNTSGNVPPSSLKFYKILPANYVHFCPDLTLNYFPLLGVDQERQAYVADGALSGGPTFNASQAMETLRAPYGPIADLAGQPPLFSGDSGMPRFVVLDGEAILIGGNTSLGSGPMTSNSIAGLNTGLAAVGSSYTVTVWSNSGLTGTALNGLGAGTSFPTY